MAKKDQTPKPAHDSKPEAAPLDTRLPEADERAAAPEPEPPPLSPEPSARGLAGDPPAAERTLVDWTAPHLAMLGLAPLPKRNWPKPEPRKQPEAPKSLGVRGAKYKRANVSTSLGAAVRQHTDKHRADRK